MCASIGIQVTTRRPFTSCLARYGIHSPYYCSPLVCLVMFSLSEAVAYGQGGK